jgi:hypothetical protein
LKHPDGSSQTLRDRLAPDDLHALEQRRADLLARHRGAQDPEHLAQGSPPSLHHCPKCRFRGIRAEAFQSLYHGYRLTQDLDRGRRIHPFGIRSSCLEGGSGSEEESAIVGASSSHALFTMAQSGRTSSRTGRFCFRRMVASAQGRHPPASGCAPLNDQFGEVDRCRRGRQALSQRYTAEAQHIVLAAPNTSVPSSSTPLRDEAQVLQILHEHQ